MRTSHVTETRLILNRTIPMYLSYNSNVVIFLHVINFGQLLRIFCPFTLHSTISWLIQVVNISESDKL